jgi:hypothetical protein
MFGPRGAHLADLGLPGERKSIPDAPPGLAVTLGSVWLEPAWDCPIRVPRTCSLPAEYEMAGRLRRRRSCRPCDSTHLSPLKALA